MTILDTKVTIMMVTIFEHELFLDQSKHERRAWMGVRVAEPKLLSGWQLRHNLHIVNRLGRHTNFYDAKL